VCIYFKELSFSLGVISFSIIFVSFCTEKKWFQEKESLQKMNRSLQTEKEKLLNDISVLEKNLERQESRGKRLSEQLQATKDASKKLTEERNNLHTEVYRIEEKLRFKDETIQEQNLELETIEKTNNGLLIQLDDKQKQLKNLQAELGRI